MQRALWIMLGILGLASAAWFWMSKRPPVCDLCLPLPDLMEFMMPKPAFPLPYPAPPAPADWLKLPAAERLTNIHSRVKPLLETELKKQSFTLGAQAFLRGFKESRELELWLQTAQGWERFRSYPIAALSGRLGPKLREGDGQTPEGFYAVKAAALNPGSSYHLSMDIGFPNARDVQQGRTGSFIMIHGREVSIGCLAMTDPVIEEIYLIVEAALTNGQAEVPVHLFPFRMTAERMQAAEGQPDEAFWRELQTRSEGLLPSHLSTAP